MIRKQALRVVVQNSLRMRPDGRLEMSHLSPDELGLVVYYLPTSNANRIVSVDSATGASYMAQVGLDPAQVKRAAFDAQKKLAEILNKHLDRSLLGTSTGSMDFSINTFLSDGRPLRVVSWSELF